MSTRHTAPRCQLKSCAQPLPWTMRQGAKFCSDKHRVAAHRLRRKRSLQTLPMSTLEWAAGVWLELKLRLKEAQAAGQPRGEIVAQLDTAAISLWQAAAEYEQPVPRDVQAWLDRRRLLL